jgi:hypothetical protein
MDWQHVLRVVDALVVQQTDKHLDSLQVAIIQGIFKGQKYAQIAQDYGCTPGHVKDTSYKLWRLLSDALDEPIHKTNLIATLERLNLDAIYVRSPNLDPNMIAPSLDILLTKEG